MKAYNYMEQMEAEIRDFIYCNDLQGTDWVTIIDAIYDTDFLLTENEEFAREALEDNWELFYDAVENLGWSRPNLPFYIWADFLIRCDLLYSVIQKIDEEND